MTANASPAVIYLMGGGRSGSTVLDNLLGGIPGYFAAGELRYMWERAVLGGQGCACGRSVQECPVWSQVLAQVLAQVQAQAMAQGVETATLEEMARMIVSLQRRSVRLRHTWQLLHPRLASAGNRRDAEEYASYLCKLYDAISAVTGARVIVDSSKSPPDAALLIRWRAAPVRLIHLVRDPRAVTYSWTRVKLNPDRSVATELPPVSTLRALADWWKSMLSAAAVRRHRPGPIDATVRYEDLMRRPAAVLAQLATVNGQPLPPDQLPFITPTTVLQRPNHSIGGNPVRLRRGEVVITEDTRWRHELSRKQYLLATALTLPLLKRYRYPLSR
jgi:hypothetical protein